MILQKQELNSVIPDLGDSASTYSIALYCQRLKETGTSLSSFNARI
jgi:hypothetical protein